VGTAGLDRLWRCIWPLPGVGTLGLVDFDVVDYTNLQRQVLHHTSDVGRPKLDSAIDKLTAINPFVRSSASILSQQPECAGDLQRLRHHCRRHG
jgi:sulfur-carrier protein adenylyltransferase/sulfurtransferase